MRKLSKREVREAMRLYAVTDSRWLGEGERLADACRAALKGGVSCLQIREKEMGEEEFLAEVREIAGLAHEYGVPLIVNDRIEAALAAGADGVHLGQGDLAAYQAAGVNVRELAGSLVLGISAHNPAEAQAAEAAGADYLGVGAVFPTGTKKDAVPLSRGDLSAVASAVEIPIVAIGGINGENMGTLAGSGVAGFAVVSAIFASSDVEGAARRLSGLTRTVLTPPVLSIAGSDSSGGAGIQADLKTMAALGCYGMTAVTALTAQNTMGVTGVEVVGPEFLEAQLAAVFADIPPAAIKTGMIPTAEATSCIAHFLSLHGAKNLVVDPVMVATSGAELSTPAAVKAMKEELFPLAAVITPNIPEAERLTGLAIKTPPDMERAGEMLYEECGCAVLIKGGHAVEDASDFLRSAAGGKWLHGERIATTNTHGTGCTLSSAIASELAKGFTLETAVAHAKRYISSALAAGFNLGHASGPLYHLV